ncbi:MAG TPA: selenocysteine-specific translation elongation factor [Candidatus Binatia bacterium]|nr:selenocysteine-specific translation elongation factor [Candidatus Binatia bacterium]
MAAAEGVVAQVVAERASWEPGSVEGAQVGTVVVGTAGHIDHGKTTLLRALTGIDADRLPEERARGMTIDVGYAHLAFEDGVELDFVDVPGHDRLLGNMLVGAGEVDAAMLVVAADDGPRPQTIEHLQLLDALGIGVGLAVVTKVDLVEADRVEAVVREVRGLLSGTSLGGAPVLAASAADGAGVVDVLRELRAVRDAVVRRWGQPGARGPLRLSIDRAFAVKGRGAVVTGTLWGGALARGASLRREPGGEEVRVRELQVHGQPRDRHDGGRTAVNLAGVPVELLRRGDVLTSDPRVHATDRLLVDLRRPSLVGAGAGFGGAGASGAGLAGSTLGPWPPRAGSVVRLHVGTDQVGATVRRIRGEEAAALLTLGREVAAFGGARGVLREPASGRMVAGVRVLDPRPPRGASRRRLTPERVAALRAAVDRGLDRLTEPLVDLHGALVLEAGSGAGSDHAGRTLALARDVRAALDAAALEAVAAHHRDTPLSAGLALPRARAAVLRRLRSLATIERQDLDLVAQAVAHVVNDLVEQGRLLRRDDLLRDPSIASEQPTGLLEAMDRLEKALDVPAPPPLETVASAAGCPPEGVRALQAAGRIVRLAPDLAWSTAAYHRLAAQALELARRAPLTPAALRDATGTSRKYVLAILEDLDRRELLTRTPEGHIPGPRAPRTPGSSGANPSNGTAAGDP